MNGMKVTTDAEMRVDVDVCHQHAATVKHHVKTNYYDIVFVCRKCFLKNGYGEDPDSSLDSSLE